MVINSPIPGLKMDVAIQGFHVFDPETVDNCAHECGSWVDFKRDDWINVINLNNGNGCIDCQDVVDKITVSGKLEQLIQLAKIVRRIEYEHLEMVNY